MKPGISSLEFFASLSWIDGRPLLDTIEPYRRDLFTKALDEYDELGEPRYNLVLAGRGKKNFKSCDLILAALYKLVIAESHQGNDGLIVANDEGQALDDLTLAKRLIACNGTLQAELEVLSAEIRRRDALGTLRVLSSRDAIGAHGKTAIFVGFDEIHGLRSWDMLEALTPGPDAACAHVDHVLRYDLQQSGGAAPRLQGNGEAWRGSAHAGELVQR
jgi:hypothetical protein